MNLRELEVGKSARVTAVGGEGALRQHFLDMGIIPGAVVTVVKYAPMGDPVELRLHGYELTLRLNDAEKIEVIPETPQEEAKDQKCGEVWVRKASASRPWRRREISPEGERSSAAGGNCPDVCARWKSEQRKDDPFQPADGSQAACG